MPELVVESSEASQWLQSAIARNEGGIYGEVKSAVIWSDARKPDGSLQVEADPETLVSIINRHPMPLLHGHDPGRPVGYLLEAEGFSAAGGSRFVVGVLGFYKRSSILTFDQFGIDAVSEGPVLQLPEPPKDMWIELLTDPRHVPQNWVDELLEGAPLPVEQRVLSHNSAEAMIELVRVGVVYLALVWNPLVKTFASEAGKAAYSGLHAWLRCVVGRLADRRAPVLSIESHDGDCHVHFLIRGTDTAVNYAAHAGLSGAATGAAALLKSLRANAMIPVKLVYEFDPKILRWSPSFVVLSDQRIITSTPELIARASDLPAGLSLGLAVEKVSCPTEP